MAACFSQGADSGSLLVLAVTLAVSASKHLDSDELGRLAAFFTVLGDVLALFALQPSLCPDDPPVQEDRTGS